MTAPHIPGRVTLTLHCDAAAAVRCGSSVAGPAKLHLDDRDLAQLTPRQRETLARHLERAEGWGAPLTDGGPPIGRADLDALRVLLDARADALWVDRDPVEKRNGHHFGRRGDHMGPPRATYSEAFSDACQLALGDAPPGTTKTPRQDA